MPKSVDDRQMIDHHKMPFVLGVAAHYPHEAGK
jgi:hypothetical protein